LLDARQRMIQELQSGLDANEHRFLLSLVQAKPDWAALGIPHVSQLPAVRWKLENLMRLRDSRRDQFDLQYSALAARLGR
jgi:hypothetical protein